MFRMFLLFFSFYLFMPGLKLLYFSPFMAMVLYRTTYKTALWVALACGFVMDIFMSHPIFGIYAFAYSSACALLFKLRHHFFSDRWSTYWLMTFLFSLFVTATTWALCRNLSHPSAFTFEFFAMDLFVFSALDATFGTFISLASQIAFRRKKLLSPCLP